MNTIPTAGIALKPDYYDAALSCDADGMWFEVHPENYYADGGPRLAWLEAVRSRHPVALHGVGLSLAAARSPDPAHLRRLAALAERIDPVIVSEHMAWSAWRGTAYPDLLPFPRTDEALAWLADNVCRTQDMLKRRIAIENPAHYLRIEGNAWDEIDFMAALSRRSGCGLLLDVNNVHVGARNLGYDAAAYIDRVPANLIMEVHLAGHTPDPVLGQALLIDSHDAPVAPDVWALYARLVARTGPRPTLIERDDNLPAFADLMAERSHAASVMASATREAA
jgi:uncharacterized protein (UPF0276 family)